MTKFAFGKRSLKCLSELDPRLKALAVLMMQNRLWILRLSADTEGKPNRTRLSMLGAQSSSTRIPNTILYRHGRMTACHTRSL